MDRHEAQQVLQDRKDEAERADQEIRARALECAVGLRAAGLGDNTKNQFWQSVKDFETYIRNGNVR